MGPDGRIGYFQRVMAHTLWPLGVDALFSFSGNASYLRENLPFVDRAFGYLSGPTGGGYALLAFSDVNLFSMALLYGCAGHLTTENGAFWPG
jgi:hypothetical protein